MKQYLIATLNVLIATLSTYASEEYYEAYNIVSRNYNDDFHDLGIIRPINGGTVIIPEFEEGCPEELQNAFSYACKILEEYMPTSLPIKVLVRTWTNVTSNNLISKVNFRTQSFRDYKQTIPMTTVKGVIYGEWTYHSISSTYLDSVPNIASLTEKPDITISYNSNLFNEISFSLESNPEDKYDFVSLALRDLIIGLGFTSNYIGNITSETLRNPVTAMNQLELLINNILGTGSMRQRYANATKGELTICDGNNGPELKLYAPAPWDESSSLRFTIPSENTSLSHIMSHSFGKGTIARGLNDNHSKFLFSTLFKWVYDFTSGGGNIGVLQESSTENLIPYNIEVKKDVSYRNPIQQLNDEGEQDSDAQHREVIDYVDSFHPFPGNTNSTGVSVSVLKKDGSWDFVFSVPFYEGETYYHNEGLDMRNWVLHCDDSEYARSPDGHLRVRHTIAKREYSTIYPNQLIIMPKYYVADYLPQKLALKAEKIRYEINVGPIPTMGINDFPADTYANLPNYRLYLKNLEGVDRIVIEYLKDGSRLPIKYPVTDFKKGYYDLDVQKTGTITAVAYNSNGYTRSEPIIIKLPEIIVNNILITNTNSEIRISSNEDNPFYEYSINRLDSSDSKVNISGFTNNSVDISFLSSGNYAIQIHSLTDNQRVSYKFAKH